MQVKIKYFTFFNIKIKSVETVITTLILGTFLNFNVFHKNYINIILYEKFKIRLNDKQ